MVTTEEFLEHYGKRGMKWGKRKPLSQKEQRDQNRKNQRKQVSVKRQHLSNRDLKAYIDRLQTEKKLKDLIDQDISPGKALAKKVLSDSGQKVVTTVITGFAVYGIKKVIENKMHIKI